MQQMQLSESVRLFAMPSFFRGMAQSLDLGNTFTNYNYSENENEADALASLSDWRQIGIDLNVAMERMTNG